jgi:hypothetical protein
MNKISFTGYRFPPEIIHQAIWLYFRFTLSLHWCRCPRPRNREAPRARSVEEQSSRELASADPTTGTQGARL